MKKNILAPIFILALAVIFNSCKKKTEVDNETQSVVDNALCEQQFMAIQPVVNDKSISEKGIKREMASCETFSIIAGDTTDANSDKIYDNGPVTFEIDYGTVGCVGPDGVYRTGKINFITPVRWSALTSAVTVTVNLVNYKANTISYSGTIKITKPNATTITTEVINGHCTNGTWNIDYQGTKTLTQTAGVATKGDVSDDVYQITGNSSGVNREGRAFSTNITSPLVKMANCKWISSGTLDLTPSGFKTRTVDFGSGGCDDQATYTVNGQTITFTLK